MASLLWGERRYSEAQSLGNLERDAHKGRLYK